MSKKQQPLVSVIMPVYNCQDYLEQAMESIIKQTYKSLEIIVVDDCSTDNSWDILQQLAEKDSRIKCFRNQQNLRIVGTLNVAIRKSTGKYLARMDGDDVRELDSIATQIAYLEKNPSVVMVGGSVLFCDDKMQPMNRRDYPLTDNEIHKVLFRYSPFCHASLVMRADIVGKDPYKYDWAEDYDLYFRLLKKGEAANLNKILYHVRTHKQSVSRSKTRYQEKLTLYLRTKAVFEYGYSMRFADKLYFIAQLSTMYIMPSGFRFWLFNKLRSGS